MRFKKDYIMKKNFFRFFVIFIIMLLLLLVFSWINTINSNFNYLAKRINQQDKNIELLQNNLELLTAENYQLSTDVEVLKMEIKYYYEILNSISTSYKEQPEYSFQPNIQLAKVDDNTLKSAIDEELENISYIPTQIVTIGIIIKTFISNLKFSLL